MLRCKALRDPEVRYYQMPHPCGVWHCRSCRLVLAIERQYYAMAAGATGKRRMNNGDRRCIGLTDRCGEIGLTIGGPIVHEDVALGEACCRPMTGLVRPALVRACVPEDNAWVEDAAGSVARYGA